MEQPMKKSKRIARAEILLVLGLLYLVFVASTFIFNMDLASNRTMQYIIHFTLIVSVIAYVFFVEMIYRTENNPADGRMALLFAALFTVPVLAGRSIGLLAISYPELSAPANLLNFYGTVSVSRAIELTGWTTLFPLSMIYLAKIFYKNQHKFLSLLCLLSAVCCTIAFLSILFPDAILVWIGVLGWGVLFILVIAVYVYIQTKSLMKDTPENW